LQLGYLADGGGTFPGPIPIPGVPSRPDPSSALAAGQFYIRLQGDQAAPQIGEEEGQFGQDPPSLTIKISSVLWRLLEHPGKAVFFQGRWE